MTSQVNDVQTTWWFTNPQDQRHVRFACYLSGDGKVMLAGHHIQSAKCWSCALDAADPAALHAQAQSLQSGGLG